MKRRSRMIEIKLNAPPAWIAQIPPGWNKHTQNRNCRPRLETEQIRCIVIDKEESPR
jgi:hypothetical protein